MQLVYFLSLLPCVVTISGNLKGGPWSALNLVFLFAVMVLLDMIAIFLGPPYLGVYLVNSVVAYVEHYVY